MSYYCENFQDVFASFQLGEKNPFLDARTIRRAFADAECEFGEQNHTVFTRETTLWAFLYEMMNTGTGRTLKSAVHAVQQLRIAKGLGPNSVSTGSYGPARVNLNAKVPLSLLASVAKNAERIVPPEMRFCGLKISIIDGTSHSMPDTDDNQEKYPQPKTQKAGLGFPLWRNVALTSAATAMIQLVAVGPWSGKGTGELSLFVSLFDQLRNMASTIDVVVGDKYYCSYHLIAALASFGIRFITRLHAKRLVNFADGENVARQENGDFHVTWKRPVRPFWMSDDIWEKIPETLTLRLVRVRIETPGARTQGFFVVTNLLDAKQYPSETIRESYRRRWCVEVDFRTIKSFMKLEILRGNTPEMVETEFATGLLAYNLVRAKMLETAMNVREGVATRKSETQGKPESEGRKTKNRIEPEDLTARNVSFSVAQTSVLASYVTTHFMSEPMREVNREQAELNRVSVQVGNRPDRVEPRCNKRRPHPHRLMVRPREELRTELLRGESPTQDGDEAATQLGEE